ncbi:putative nuclease HARBI1 [Ostrea edulis]|uniref:putative nuclease HARBI1 n=1 Tax=Ostrea edulis TaxID=37623 RepID=UPI00209541D5|nr:putative nuclease HARBI1 [Ostrea edulis]XP_056012117.1 putative nuclease HARBI1 [Ostrea edulis]XP_056012118.1 putative nuclease HARBI1 [Ostrea edulis]
MASAAARLNRYNIIRRRRRAPRPRIFQDRSNPLEDLEGDEVFIRFRFRPDTILWIVGLVFDDLQRQTHRNCSLPPLLQVLAALRFLATGSFYNIVGESLGISKSATGRAARMICRLLSSMAARFINFPANLDSYKRTFFEIAGFPNVVGCVDGTQIKIKAPSENEGDFINRKGFHSLNIQMVCGPNFNITNVVAKWPGSVHDSRMFKESLLCREFENGHIQGILLGDSGYALKKYLMTPYLNPSDVHQERYNGAHCRTRVLIEQTFGILKRRFAGLHTELRLSPERACNAIVACCVLHNIGIVRGDILQFRGNDCPQNPTDYAERNVRVLDGKAVRDHIARNYF